MKQYRLLKRLESKETSLPIGAIFKTFEEGFIELGNGLKIPLEICIEQGFIQEVKEVIQPIVPDKWKVFGEEGWYIDKFSDITHFTNTDSNCVEDKNVRPTRELAEACLAMSQLSQLRNETWKRDGDWKPDWSENSQVSKNIIEYYDGSLYVNTYKSTQRFLAFRTALIRDEFLEKHRELIEKAKPLL